MNIRKYFHRRYLDPVYLQSCILYKIGYLLDYFPQQKYVPSHLGSDNEMLFQLKMTPEQKQSLLELMDIFLELTHAEYAIGYGALLGAKLYKGFIPWDDDIDLLCKLSNKAAIRERCMASDKLHWFECRPRRTLHYSKVCLADLPPAEGFPWSWPFLDILWLEDDGSDLYREVSNNTRFKKSAIFPSIIQPFEDRNYCFPNDMAHVVDTCYPQGMQTASPSWWHHVDHRQNPDFQPIQVPLAEIAPIYPVLYETLPHLKQG